jgi:hypothetical protein
MIAARARRETLEILTRFYSFRRDILIGDMCNLPFSTALSSALRYVGFSSTVRRNVINIP